MISEVPLMPIKNKKLLYHFTSLNNIEDILINGLLPRKQAGDFDDVADPEIIDFREENGLNDYVPFHYFAKNPFDGRVQINHPGKNFIYICVNRIFAKNRNFRIIPMHPIAMGENIFLYDYDEGFEVIEWDVMEKRDYLDEHCKHICMAECLSDRVVYPHEFSCIFVKDDNIKNYIQQVTNKMLGKIPFMITVNANMFRGE